MAVAALMDPARHGGRSYRPTGPTLMSAYDMVPIISKVLGRRVTGMKMPWALFIRAAKMQGLTPDELGNFRHYLVDHRQGAFAYQAPNDVVAELTGTPAEPFEATVARYAALPFASRTAANRRRVITDFLRVPFAGAARSRPAYPRTSPARSRRSRSMPWTTTAGWPNTVNSTTTEWPWSRRLTSHSKGPQPTGVEGWGRSS